MEDMESGDDLLERAFKFLENKSPRAIKNYFGENAGDGGAARSNDEKSEEEKEVVDEKVLEPDHPLLAKFQIALKEHLLRQIDHMNNDIFEYETGAKKKNTERETLGAQAYETQQIVSKQQSAIDQYVAELENVSSARKEIENQLQESVTKYKEEKQLLFEAEKKEIELRKEVESVNLLLQQMSNWENEIESELKTSQTVFEKTRKDKLKLAEEKREQDMLLYKLMTEVWRLEGELETMLMQLRVQEEEREKMAENMAISNTDIEATQAEHRCLIRGWHSVVIAIGARDKHFNHISQELLMNNEKMRNIISEIEQVKKLCKKEMNRNETLTMFKLRVEGDISSCKHQLETEEVKRTNLERTMMQLQAVLEQTGKDLNRVTTENHVRNRELRVLVVEFEKVQSRKMELEESIMVILQDQLTNDKASKYLGKVLGDVKTKNRELDISLSSCENRNAKVLMDMETQKRINTELQNELNELTKQQTSIEKQLTEYVDEINKLHSLAHKREREVHILNIKLDTLTERTGESERSPHELKISSLEQHIVATQDKNKELQKFWLREQGHVVCLSEQRQEQIHDCNLIRKQTMILEQRNLKINDELNVYKKQEEQMSRNINKLQNLLVNYTERLGKKKFSKQFLDESNIVLQTEFTFTLKDLELAVIRLESELQDINQDMQQLSEELLEKNREALEWEKKYKMVLETKKNIAMEKGEGGEVGNMRTEIHRMQVRYSQLKKAQDRLINDLEHCVSRRDVIVTNAEAKEKRIKGAQSNIIFNRKLDDTRNKLKQLQDDISNVEETISNLDNEIKFVHGEKVTLENDIAATESSCKDVSNRIDEEKTNKQVKLELLLLQQRRLKIYVELSKGRVPFLSYRTEGKISEEYEKQKKLNNRLQHVADNLMNDFPGFHQKFLRISNTLKLSAFI